MLFQRGTDYSPVGPNNIFKEAGRALSTGKGSFTNVRKEIDLICFICQLLIVIT
jgi:hypothetical protein